MILCILINFAIFNKFKLNNKIVYLFFYFKIKYFINFFFYFIEKKKIIIKIIIKIKNKIIIKVYLC